MRHLSRSLLAIIAFNLQVGVIFASNLTYDDFVPGTLRLPPFPDVRLANLIYDYQFDAATSVGTLDIDGAATNLRFGGANDDLSTATSLPIFTSRLPGQPPISGVAQIDVSVGPNGELLSGNFVVTGGLNPDPRLPVAGGINWIDDPNPFPVFGTAGSATLLAGTITDIIFDTTLNANNAFGGNVFLEFQVTEGELMSFGGDQATGFGLAGSPGYINLQNFGDINVLGGDIWETSFTDTNRNADIAVPAPTVWTGLLAMMVFVVPVMVWRRHPRQLPVGV